MFDIGWQELFILAVLAIIVIGPKDLPRAVRTITKWIRKARSMARDLQDGLDEVAREAELDDLKKELDSPGGLDIAKKIEDAVDPTGEIAEDMDLDKDLYDEMSGAVDDLKKITGPDSKTDAAEDSENAPRDSKDIPKDSENAAGDDGPAEGETQKTSQKASG
ncbi:MAG: twin-arginine translocase subunit TatB [Rhodospirillaceae bacterium]|jgi:sec-independent protein translocase protein TatB|nr:twin-arginine translocase subunit TatB [Rhodospirillaceae bacterium]|tara:strand:+ start:3017 stop:3505 length:489 start_codon:yes stop_codon:yes gene_type:complete